MHKTIQTHLIQAQLFIIQYSVGICKTKSLRYYLEDEVATLVNEEETAGSYEVNLMQFTIIIRNLLLYD